MCACVCAPLVPRHSWLGCAVWVCVLGLGFRLRPATPGWGVGVCVCLCVRSACTPPLLAGVCGVGGFAWARVLAAPRHSWLGCWGVCVLVCALRLHPATPGRGVRCGLVCLGSGFGCAPPLLAGVLGRVCVCVCAPLAPLPLLVGVCGVGVCAWARVSAAPRHSWLGCAVWVCVAGPGFWLRAATPGSGVGVLCVLVCALRLYPATPCLGVRCGCVCLGSGFGCAPPLLAGVLGCVWLAWALGLHPATPGWGARCGCVCLGSGFSCAPPPLAGVLGCVCARVRAPLVPRTSRLGCAVWVWVFGLGFRLRPATPGWGIGVCVCWWACSSCTPPLLAGVCFVGVCARARVLAAPRHSWLGSVVCGLAVAWHLFLCRGSLRVVRALRVCRPRRPSLLGTCPCALVVAGGVPLWRAFWPRVVRRAASGPVALSASVGFPEAVVRFPNPGACAPGFTGWLRGARGGRPVL